MGVITALEVQKRNKKRVNVFLDGEFAFGLGRMVAAYLKVGQALTPHEIGQLIEQDAQEVSYEKALHYLSFRPRSTHEVRNHLTKKKISPDVIANTIQRLEKNRLLDDLAFAELWVENRSTFRPRGVIALRSELRSKGIRDGLIDQVLEGFEEETLAYQAGVKKAKKIPAEDKQVFMRKLYGFMSRRGFRSEVIREITNRIWEERQNVHHKDNESWT